MVGDSVLVAPVGFTGVPGEATFHRMDLPNSVTGSGRGPEITFLAAIHWCRWSSASVASLKVSEMVESLIL